MDPSLQYPLILFFAESFIVDISQRLCLLRALDEKRDFAEPRFIVNEFSPLPPRQPKKLRVSKPH